MPGNKLLADKESKSERNLFLISKYVPSVVFPICRINSDSCCCVDDPVDLA